MQSLYYLIPMFLIILFIFPLILQVRVSFSLEDFSGVICLFIFKIKVKYYMYQIKGSKIILQNEKQTKIKEFEFDPSQLVIAQIFKSQLKNKARVKELFVFYNIGLGDAFRSAMVGGVINTAVLTYFTMLKNKRPTASFGIYDTISYNREVFEVAGKGSVSISLFDVAYSLLMSVILIKNLAKQNKKEQVWKSILRTKQSQI